MPKVTKKKDVENYVLAYEEKYKCLPSRTQIARETGVFNSTIDTVLIHFKEAREKKKVSDPIKYTKAQQGHIEAAIKIHKRELDAILEETLRDRIKAYIDKHMPSLKAKNEELSKKIEYYDMITNRFKPIFTAEEFRAILMCLHPDGIRTKEKLEQVFNMVKEKEKPLTGRK